MNEKLLKNYVQFVNEVMSADSKDLNLFRMRCDELEVQGINVPTLLTAGLGLSGEAGEVGDLVKKIVFHGKPYTPEIKDKFEKEAGDVCWYLAALCLALGLDFEQIILQNIVKLQTRYPGGTFSIEASENRIV